MNKSGIRFLRKKRFWIRRTCEEKKTALHHVFPSILVSTNKDWVYILEPKNETFDTPLIVDIMYFEQTAKNEIKYDMILTNQEPPLTP